MIVPCNGENGCGTLVRTGSQTPMTNNDQHMSVPDMQRSQMTNYIPSAPGTSNNPSPTGVIASTMPMPGMWSQTEDGVETIPGQPDPPSNRDIPGIPNPGDSAPDSVLPESPQFQVPANPLLPPGYQEYINYDNLQYMNGFLRTQIGKYLRVEQLVTSTDIQDRFGYLVGVGLNYILLQQPGTGNISAIDYYSIKYVYVYYRQDSLPTG